MINTSNEYKKTIRLSGKKQYAKVNIILNDSTLLLFDNSNIMNNGLTIKDGTSANNSFKIGSAIINELTLNIANFDGAYNDYDFLGAVIRPSIGLQLSETIEILNKGVFTVDDAKAVGSTIVLTALDNMYKFDTHLSEVNITYPITAFNLLYAICTHCGVSLSTLNFTNKDFLITRELDDEATTCREVVAWIAQIAGCFARCNTQGALELKWYDVGAFEQSDNLDGGKFDNTNNTSYQTGDSANGGDFTNYNSGDNINGGTFLQMGRYHHIYALNQATISTDDIIITGIQVKAMGTKEDYGETVLFGNKGYVIEITDNPLITENTASIIANSVGAKIVGMMFRPLNILALSDPSIEAGDVAYVSSKKGNRYQTLITNISYTIGNYESITCDAETPSKKQSVRFTPDTKAIIEARKEVQRQLTAYDLAVQQLNGIMANAMGFYEITEIKEDGSKIIYMCDKPTVAESMVIWKKSIDGFAISTDGGKTWTSGMTADGNIIAKTLAVIGINAEWIKVLTYFTVGNYFSVDALGNLLSKSGKIGPFMLNGNGLFSDTMSFYDDNKYPLIWLTKRGDDNSLFPSEGSSRANYEPDVCVVRNIKDGVLTDMHMIARAGENGKVGYLGIDKSKDNKVVSEVRLSDTGLSVDNYTDGNISKSHSLNDSGVSWNDYDTGNSSNIFVDNSSGDMYIQSSNKVYINGRNLDDIDYSINQQLADIRNDVSKALSDIIAIKIKLGMPIN